MKKRILEKIEFSMTKSIYVLLLLQGCLVIASQKDVDEKKEDIKSCYLDYQSRDMQIRQWISSQIAMSGRLSLLVEQLKQTNYCTMKRDNSYKREDEL